MEFVNYAQLIIGPAGSGKSTYCKIIQDHALILKRSILIINLDPAAENFNYKPDIDIRDLIKVEDVMKKNKLGPNGALLYCMEYLLSNLDWLDNLFEQNGENIYYIIDCPGQLELYNHYDIMRKITNHLKKNGFSICSVFCLDCTFLQEQYKFISGSLLSIATMIQMELPHVTVLTKCDLISKTDLYQKILNNDIESDDIKEELIKMKMGKNMKKLHNCLTEFIENYAIVQLYPLNLNDEDTINALLYNLDSILQYFESQDPKDNIFDQAEKDLMDIDDYKNNE